MAPKRDSKGKPKTGRPKVKKEKLKDLDVSKERESKARGGYNPPGTNWCDFTMRGCYSSY